MKKLSVVIAFMMLFTFGIATTQNFVQPRTVYAADTQLESVMDGIQNSSSVLKDGTKNKVQGLSNDIQEICLIIAIGVLMCVGILKAIHFANVGDNASEKSKVKQQIIWLVLGIVFLASYFGLMRFGFTNFNLFS